ncbi:MAG: hypothetical protein QGG73_12970, partial [Candidatus Hydrogenedentes bacterium]|nr:hypothetical protein [Candidatus Hydrogenedentota bacterium]
LAIEVILLFVAILVGITIAGISIVESTGLVRRFIRHQAKTVNNMEHRVEAAVTESIMPRLAKVERYSAWVTTFVRSIRRDEQG